jgi:hypothetical protein
MIGKIRLYDYRCFRREAPATLEFDSGFTSFVGPNNSGKSALIRVPYELRFIFSNVASMLNPSNWSSLHNQMGWNLSPGLYECAEIICEREQPACAVEIEPAIPDNYGGEAVGRIRLEFDDGGNSFRCKVFSRQLSVLPAIGSGGSNFLGDDLVLAGNRYSTAPLKQFLTFLGGIQYIGPFRNAINEGAGLHFDVQVGTSFISQWNTWKTGASRVQNRAVQRVTEDVRKLIGAKTLEVSASADGKSLQVVVDGRPHKLQELGAGFSQLVLVLANALVKKPSLVTIDEPELHLHPSLQTAFLTTLASYATHGVMFATHSIGLARQAGDRCFTVQRIGEGSTVRPYERTPHLAEFLGSLGIAGLQELGWNTVLLVEGVKDVRTAQAFLATYGKDRSAVVLPLGGDAMVNGNTANELSEVLRLAGADGKVVALVDSERDSAESEPIKARRDFSTLCAGLGILHCVTQRRAIENYVTQASLDGAFAPGAYQALNAYDRPGTVFWGKGETWRAAKRMTIAELNETDLGQFFSNL